MPFLCWRQDALPLPSKSPVAQTIFDLFVRSIGAAIEDSVVLVEPELDKMGAVQQEHMMEVGTSQMEQQIQPDNRPRDWSWGFWHLVPLYPYNRRRTLRSEVVKDTIWTFDQLQGIFYTVVPIRMTVVLL